MRPGPIRVGISTVVAIGVVVLLTCLGYLAGHAARPAPFDWVALKATWHARIEAVRARGMRPILDVSSTYHHGIPGMLAFTRCMDRLGVAIIAESPELHGSQSPKFKLGGSEEGDFTGWPVSIHRLIRSDPSHFMPEPTAGLHEVLGRGADANAFLDDLFDEVRYEKYPMMGEFFFRHYPSNVQYRQVLSGSAHNTDYNIPIDGPYGQRIFAFSQASGVPFQIHLDVEDALLPRLESMLKRYPGAKVVWCHVGRVRYRARGLSYGPDYMRDMLRRCPNLYFDTSCTNPNDVYWPSGERASRLWVPGTDRMDPRWVRLIADYPYHFLAALDLGSDRNEIYYLSAYTRDQRHFLSSLPPAVADIVAWRATWKLMFHEEYRSGR